jgi:ribosomal protein S18 acetylase RimI-like enzyme
MPEALRVRRQQVLCELAIAAVSRFHGGNPPAAPRQQPVAGTVAAVEHRIDIRPLAPGEYEAAGAATLRAFAEHNPPDHSWDRYLARLADVGARAETALVLVASVDGVVAGTATLELEQRIPLSTNPPLRPDEAHLRMLGVDPAFRGLGLARRLVQACIDAARAHGKRCLTLDTAPEMIAAQTLYISMGFRFTGTTDRLGNDQCLLMYELAID